MAKAPKKTATPEGRAIARIEELRAKAAGKKEMGPMGPMSPVSPVKDAGQYPLVRRAARAAAELAGTTLRRNAVEVLGVPGREYQALAGSYSAARTDRTRMNAPPIAVAPDAHLDEFTHDLLRRFCQDIYRNNDVAGMLVDRLADALIGDCGPTLDCLSTDEDFNAAAEDYWCQWCQRPDVTGMRTLADVLRDAIADACTDGDLGFLFTTRGLIQAVEGQRIVQPRGVGGGAQAIPLDNGNTAVRGIEFDAYGAPVAFYVAGFSSAGLLNRAEARRIPAESMFLARSPLGRASNQTRGLPTLARIVRRLGQFEEYNEASILAAIVACNFAALIKTENPTATAAALAAAAAEFDDEQGGVVGTAGDVESGYDAADISPLALTHLKPGESAEQLKPEHPTTTFDAFGTFQVRLIGAAVGLPIELTMLDSSKSNYYGTRASLASTYRGLAPWRRFTQGICERFYRWVIGRAIDEGKIPFVPDWAKIEWISPGAPMIKVGEEMGGLADAVDRLMMTRKRALVIAGSGEFGKFVRERGQEKEMELENGLVPVTMPGAGGGSAAPGNAQDAPDAEDAGGDQTGGADPEDAADLMDPAEEADGGGGA